MLNYLLRLEEGLFLLTGLWDATEGLAFSHVAWGWITLGELLHKSHVGLDATERSRDG